jgi:hypothetical protein
MVRASCLVAIEERTNRRHFTQSEQNICVKKWGEERDCQEFCV